MNEKNNIHIYVYIYICVCVCVHVLNYAECKFVFGFHWFPGKL